jgi:hypothetical protein
MALMGTACGGGTSASGGNAASNSVQPSATPSVQASATPTVTPTVAEPKVLPNGGPIFPGTYTTLFQPKMSLTISEHGQGDVDTPTWVGMEFGSGSAGLGFSIIRIVKVFDPMHEGKLIDPPKDLAGWIANRPGLKVVAPPTSVRVGRIPGMQLDVLAGPKNVGFGPPLAGIGANHRSRLIVVRVDGQYVLIGFGPDEIDSPRTYSAAEFAAAVSALQPLVDSITWG